MKRNGRRNTWMIDAALFVGFLAACWLDLTGVAIHEWLGVGIVALAGYHLLTHWSWVKSVSARFWGRTSSQARGYYMLDAGLLLGFLLVLLTGLVISTWLALPLANYADWVLLHVAASVITLCLVLFKIALHWRWIVTTGKRYVLRPAVSAANVRPMQPILAPAAVERREFLRLMGVVGLTAVLPFANATQALLQGLVQPGSPAEDEGPLTLQPAASTVVNPTPAVVQAQATATSSPKTTPTPAPAMAQGSRGSSACTVLCRKNCSYPGRCRKYVDRNQNNRCDLSECA